MKKNLEFRKERKGHFRRREMKVEKMQSKKGHRGNMKKNVGEKGEGMNNGRKLNPQYCLS